MVQELMGAARDLDNLAASIPQLMSSPDAVVQETVQEISALADLLRTLAKRDADPIWCDPSEPRRRDGRSRLAGQTITSVSVMQSMRDLANPAGEFEGAIQRIIDRCGFARETVVRALGVLERQGKIVCLIRAQGKGRPGRWRLVTSV